jgi:hypothetical protein
MLDQENGDAVVGSPRGEQHISLVKCSAHHSSLKNERMIKLTLYPDRSGLGGTRSTANQL